MAIRKAQVMLKFDDDGSVEIYDNVSVDCTGTVAEGKMTDKEREALPPEIRRAIGPNERYLRYKTLTLTERKLQRGSTSD